MAIDCMNSAKVSNFRQIRSHCETSLWQNCFVRSALGSFGCLSFSSHLSTVAVAAAGVVKFSVTRLGDLLDFGHVFKAFGNN